MVSTANQLNYAKIVWLAIKRKALWNRLAKSLGIVYIAEYPKSGGTWLGQILSEYYGLPFPRNTMSPPLGRSVLHGHEMPKSHFDKGFVMVRDGRDVVISFYFHYLFPNDWNQHSRVMQHRKRLGYKDFQDVRENLPSFIDYLDEHWGRQMNHFTWSEFIVKWFAHAENHEQVSVVKYEDMLTHPLEALSLAIEAVSGEAVDNERLAGAIEKYTFSQLSGRTPGTEDRSSFIRKGVAGDWVNYLSPLAAERFDALSGDALIYSGYEKDRTWVGKVGAE